METKEKQILWGAAAIIVLLVVFFLFSNGSNRDSSIPGGENAQHVTETSEDARVIKKDAEDTLSAFPAGFPVEEGFAEAEGYVYVPADSLEEQSTLDYVSKRSLSENAVRFREFLVDEGFEIVNETSEESFVFYYATKDDNDLSVSIEEKNGKTKISASYLERKNEPQ